MAKRSPPYTASRQTAELRELAKLTAGAAMTATADQQSTILAAAERLDSMADYIERRAKVDVEKPAIATLPADATAEEVRKARRIQAIQRGQDVFLPCWSATSLALPNALLRSALFSCSKGAQSDNDRVLAADQSTIVIGLEVASLQNMTMTYSGYPLCQFDRHVYATCLNFYRQTSLAPDGACEWLRSSFYALAKIMGISYGKNTHRAILASLCRLRAAHLRLRINQSNLEIASLLSLDLAESASTAQYKGSDVVGFSVPTSVATLYGPGAWTAVDRVAAGYDGLTGWLASFYTSHAGPHWLPVDRLYDLSGYASHVRNFRASLKRSLDKLLANDTPSGCRVRTYKFSEDGTKLLVHLARWRMQ